MASAGRGNSSTTFPAGTDLCRSDTPALQEPAPSRAVRRPRSRVRTTAPDMSDNRSDSALEAAIGCLPIFRRVATQAFIRKPSDLGSVDRPWPSFVLAIRLCGLDALHLALTPKVRLELGLLRANLSILVIVCGSPARRNCMSVLSAAWPFWLVPEAFSEWITLQPAALTWTDGSRGHGRWS
jgi:hypothetical protein